MWCRYCGTTETSRFRPGPCGLLCNAHWKRWKKNLLVLPTEEPTSALCPIECNEYVFVKKRKRPNITTLLHSLQWYRTQWVKKETLVASYQQYHAHVTQLRSLSTPNDILQCLTHLPSPPVVGTLATWLQEPPPPEGPVMFTHMQERTDTKLATCSTVILQEIQSIRNNLAIWFEDSVPTMVHFLREGPNRQLLREQYTMAKEEQDMQLYLEQTWWIERQYHWTLSWNRQLSTAPNDQIDHPDLQPYVYPHSLKCFVRVRPVDSQSWLVRYRGSEKRLVRFDTVQRLQTSALFYHQCAHLHQVQSMDFVFVTGNTGWMVTPSVPGGAMMPSHPTTDVMQQLINVVLSFPTVHGALQWNNLWWTGNHRHLVMIRNECPPLDRFRAPILTNTIKDDLWSLGVILFKKHTGHYPITPLETVPRGDIVVSTIIDLLLRTNPDERILPTNLVDHCTPHWFYNTLQEQDMLDLVRTLLRYKRRQRWETSVYEICRDDLIGTVFAAFASMNNLSDPIEFRYHGDPGQGRGVTRDVYNAFFLDIVEHGLLHPSHGLPETCTKCAQCPYAHNYTLLGTIMAKLVLDELVVPISMCHAWTRYMMGQPPTADDLREVSDDHFNTLVRYQREDNITAFHIPWKHTYVTNENKQMFIQDRIEHFLYHGRRKALDEMRRGFVSHLTRIMSVLRCGALHHLVFGLQRAILPKDLPLRWNAPTTTQAWFFSWLTPPKVPAFLTWATGSRRLAYPPKNINMGVSSQVTFPQAHTCTRDVWLPQAGTPEDWSRAMDVSLAQVGFSFN